MQRAPQAGRRGWEVSCPISSSHYPVDLLLLLLSSSSSPLSQMRKLGLQGVNMVPKVTGQEEVSGL